MKWSLGSGIKTTEYEMIKYQDDNECKIIDCSGILYFIILIQLWPFIANLVGEFLS